MIDPVMLPGLNGARAQQGLPPEPHFFAHMLAAPDASLGLFPAWFAAPQADWPPHFAQADFTGAAMPGAAALPPELERFLGEGEPPIVFTPGTGHQHAQRYFSIALDVLRRLGRRGLFLTPHAAQLPQHMPASVMWQAHAPFAALLPRAAAVVHHGGIGTSADVFRAGIPQLIVPFAYDQFDNGWRAKRLGVGMSCWPGACRRGACSGSWRACSPRPRSSWRAARWPARWGRGSNQRACWITSKRPWPLSLPGECCARYRRGR